MMDDPRDPVCSKCHHGSEFCVNECDYFLIDNLHDKYPKETKKLFNRVKRETLKRISTEEVDEDPDDEDMEDDE